MIKLPLFPLNTVLFPGMPLSLHIFEERYKQMIGTCIQMRQPFGVVLIQNGVEAYGPAAEPHIIGCTAQITQVQPLAEGRMNILAVGHERFQILSLDNNLPYLTGLVRILPMNTQDSTSVTAAGHKLRPWVERYLHTLSEIDNLQFDLDQLPADPLALAYLAAFLLQVPPGDKQTLLANNHALTLLNDIRTLYRKENTILQAVVTKPQMDDFGIFSLN